MAECLISLATVVRLRLAYFVPTKRKALLKPFVTLQHCSTVDYVAQLMASEIADSECK